MYNSLTKYVFWNRDTSIFVFGFVYEKAEGKNTHTQEKNPEKKKKSCSTSQQRLLTDISGVQEFTGVLKRSPNLHNKIQLNVSSEVQRVKKRIYCLFKLTDPQWKWDLNQCPATNLFRFVSHQCRNVRSQYKLVVISWDGDGQTTVYVSQFWESWRCLLHCWDVSVMLVYGSTSASHKPLSEIETAKNNTMPKALTTGNGSHTIIFKQDCRF